MDNNLMQYGRKGISMTKVITYGTFDLIHYGHIKLLERAKKWGIT